MERRIDILDYIPTGRENAVSRKQLADRTGMNDREVRRAIETARGETPVISREDGGGYFLPRKDPEDIEAVNGYVMRERKRAVSVLDNLGAAERWLMDKV